MSRSPTHGLFAHVESFFTEYLPRQRGASGHTIRAYRDALTLLFKFIAKQRGRGVASLQLSDLDADAVTRFLDHIETERSNSAATRNCRRTAIRSFFKHVLRNDLAHSQQYMRVLAIPAKKARQRPATYLEAEDVRLIINMPDKRTRDGWRDYALLLFLYNCGARVSEATGLRWVDLQLAAPRQVRLRGKGKKERILPLWPETANALHRLRGMARGADQQCVFLNRLGQPLTRDGIAYVLTKHATAAARNRPSLKRKHITPHVLRHSCAVALLQSGADVTVIRDYLGHASVATTSRYITTNLQMKREAMQAFWKKAGIEPANTKPWITQAVLVEAARAVDRMGAQERLRLADEIFAHQPNLLASVVVLRQMGASDPQIEVPLHVLLVAWQAMKGSKLPWPLISEHTQDICLQRLTGRMRFAEGLSPRLPRRTLEQYIEKHGERYLLAFAYGHLRDNGVLGVRTEVEQHLVLVTLNLVECIAASAPKARAA